jgi:hypothetical protein
MELKHFKTDKNGTKYFHDWTCPRCGGAGYSDKWIFTGRTCYECGGTGKRNTPKIVKEYTPEYAAKLAERRKARQKANEPTEEQKAELKRLADETNARRRERLFNQHGCDKNGHGYAYIGKTYNYKNTFREAGGKWINYAQLWVCPQLFEVSKNIKVVEIDISDKINFETEEYFEVYKLLNSLN